MAEFESEQLFTWPGFETAEVGDPGSSQLYASPAFNTIVVEAADANQFFSTGTVDPPEYLMRARDAGRSAGSDYIVWIATGDPDLAGTGYAGGTPTPIGAMVVGSVVVMALL